MSNVKNARPSKEISSLRAALNSMIHLWIQHHERLLACASRRIADDGLAHRQLRVPRIQRTSALSDSRGDGKAKFVPRLDRQII